MGQSFSCVTEAVIIMTEVRGKNDACEQLLLTSSH